MESQRNHLENYNRRIEKKHKSVILYVMDYIWSITFHVLNKIENVLVYRCYYNF